MANLKAISERDEARRMKIKARLAEAPAAAEAEADEPAVEDQEDAPRGRKPKGK